VIDEFCNRHSPDHQIVTAWLEALRPSRIFVRADKASNGAVNVRVGGYSVEIARGEVFL
jgi:predicted PhzF superfamily epimerase YddE/YHI9